MRTKNFQITTGKVRFNYVVLKVPKAVAEGQEPRYSLRILIPKTEEEMILRLQEMIREARKSACEKERWQGALPSEFKSPLRDGDLEHPEDLDYKGHYFINASTKHKPLVLDEHKRELTDYEMLYSGCYGRVVVNFYPYETEHGKGIGCGLLGVQKLEDGERIGAYRITADAFSDFI